MTATGCAYRWKYYLDPSICKEQLSQSEELLMFQMLKKSDLSNDNFWFELGGSFKNRPPTILKEKATTLLVENLEKLNQLYVTKTYKKRYHSRISYFTIEIYIVFFRLAKEKKPQGQFLSQVVLQCTKLISILERAIINGVKNKEYQDVRSEITQDRQDEFHSVMECLLFIDTLFMIHHCQKPYGEGDVDDRNRLEILMESSHQRPQGMTTQTLEERKKASLYDDTIYMRLEKEELRLIRHSDVIMQFTPYFKFSDMSSQ